VWHDTAVAPPRQKNIVERLADAGEEAIQRFGNAPGADRVLGALNSMRDRLDEMQKRLRGLDELEKRLTAVEKRLDKVEGKGQSSGTRKTPSSSTRRKSSSSS
jgi:phage shock protein A